jgi:LysR family hydrogen peroxide-inducible transcriptional activator
MTLRELRYFLAVADTGHFGRAAARCHVSQPTLSAGIQNLEHFLGVRLVDRTTRRVSLTGIGLRLAEQARRTVDEANRVHAMARAYQDPYAGPFRLGAIPTVGPYLLPDIVPSVRIALPRLELFLREGLTAELLADLQRGALDAVICAEPVPDERHESVPLYDEPFVLAVHSDHRLAAQANARQGDLTDEVVLLLDDGHCFREHVLEVCGHNRRDTQEAFGSASLETIANMVASGIGCTLLPTLMVQSRPGRKGLEIREFAIPMPCRRVSLVWRVDTARAEAAQRLAELVRDHVGDGVRVV